MSAQALRAEEAAAPYLVAPLLTDQLDTFATAPEGFKRLRELVLNLAVRGRLVSTKHSTWKHICVADICSVVTDGEHVTPARIPDTTAIPLVTAKNVRDGQMDYSNTDYVPKDVAVKCWQRCKPEVGDVLMVSVGATLGRLTVLREAKEMVLVRSVTLLRPISSLVTSDYVALHLKSPTSQVEIWSVVRQSAQPCLYLGKTAALKIALPPLAEQSRIVAKVEELMALIDRLEAKVSHGETARGKLLDTLLATLADSPDAAATADAWAQLAPHFDLLLQTPADVDRLQQTLLTLAVKGRLVPQDPKDEPAAELIKRIRAEKERLVAEGEMKRADLGQCKTVRESEELPDGWQGARLGEVIYLISGQHLKPGEYAEGLSRRVPYLTGPAEFGEISPTPTRSTDELRAVANIGDILLTVKGSGVGKTNVVSQSSLAISRQLMAVRPILANASFIHLVLRSSEDIFQANTVGIAIPGISRDDVQDLEIGLPPLPEQSRIVAAVASLAALCDRLREHLAARRALSAKLAVTLTESALA